MQLLHDHQTIMATVRDINIANNVTTKDAPSENLEMQVKEKRSSNTSLLMMNPVASGDNVTTGLNSAHKLDELPSLVPCCEGKELQINEELVRTGLSAISVKHDHCVIHCLSMPRPSDRPQVLPGLVKHRNSFRCLHRPDLKRVPYLRRMTPDELETLFRGYSDRPPCRPTRNSTDIRGPWNAFENRDLVDDNRTREAKKDIVAADDGNAESYKSKLQIETRSGAEDVPAGMRLHGARARLYTSVLAGAKAGDQLDILQTSEEFNRVADDPLPEDEVQLNEELQIILPPRIEDVTAESSTTTASSDATASAS